MATERLDYIGIGVHKAASRWLVTNLTDHPEVETAWGEKQSELNYFNFNYIKGYDWYHRRFDFNSKVSGEMSVRYFNEKSVPARIHRYNSEVKLLLTLRDPVERAYSHHKHEVRQGRIPPELYEFQDALQCNPSYLEGGMYARKLKRFLNQFPRDQIHIMLVREIANHPEGVLKELFEFLGVQSSFRPESSREKVHSAHDIHFSWLKQLLLEVPKVLRSIRAEPLVDLVKSTGLPDRIREWNRKDINEEKVPPLDAETREQLLAYFRPEIEELEDLIERDLSDWKQ
ncbi:MAG: sulfotransferase domain-containing protein [bacterium]